MMDMKNILRYSAMAAVTSAMLCACSGSGNKDKAAEPVAEKTPLVAVQAATVSVVSDDQVYSSTVQPWAKNNIVPQAGGRIEELLVEVGDYVSQGQVVARMEDVQLLQAELQVGNDKVEFERIKGLYERGGVSQSDFEAFELACKVHKSTYENLLRNTVLRSPVSGVISARNYDKGDICSVAMPIYVVEQIVPVKLLLAVSESDYNRVHKGDAASISVDSFPGETFVGKITNIYPTIDAATHTFTVEVKVDNNNRKLRPGMYAKVTVTFGNATRVMVPDVAVVKQLGSGERFVYLYNEQTQTVDYTKVTVGRRYGNQYVILEGLKEGDKVVTEGILRIRDGVKVNVK